MKIFSISLLFLGILAATCLSQIRPPISGVVHRTGDFEFRGGPLYFPNNEYLDASGTTIDYNWGFSPLGSPFGLSYFSGMYSIRWNGIAVGKTTETYTLRTIADGGVRLYFDGQLVIDQWADTGRRQLTAQVQVEAGKSYPLTLEYQHVTERAEAHLYWSSPSIPTEVIEFDYAFESYPDPLEVFNPSEMQTVFNDISDIPDTQRTRRTEEGESVDSIDLERLIINSYDDSFAFIYDLDRDNGPSTFYSTARGRGGGYGLNFQEPGSGYNLFIDTDLSANTGYRAFSTGADFLIQGRQLYRYTGNGNSWSWALVAYTWFQKNNGPSALMQHGVKREWLGNPTGFNLVFYGDNAAESGGTTVDVAPDNASDGGVYAYRENGQSGGNAPIIFDGLINDWFSYTSRYRAEGFENSPVDIRQLFVHNTADEYNIGYWMHHPIVWNGGYMLYIDANRNSNVGYPLYGRKAEYMIRDFRVFRYSGGTTGAWSWEFIGNAENVINGNSAEMRFPKSWLGNQLPGTRFEFKFYGDTGFNPNTDVYPNQNIFNNANAAPEWAEYRIQ